MTATARPESPARGRAAYMAHCALCHGERADGRGPRQANLTSPPRDFTSPVWRRTASFERLIATIRHGVPGTPMPAWPVLSDEEVRDLAAYLLSVAPGAP